MTIPGVTGSIPDRSFVKEMSDFLVDRIPSCLLHDIHMHEGRYVKKKFSKYQEILKLARLKTMENNLKHFLHESLYKFMKNLQNCSWKNHPKITRWIPASTTLEATFINGY